MSNVIEWKTATQIIEMLTSQNAMVSGMSIAEAAAALGFTRTASGLYIKTVITTAANSVVGTSAAVVATSAAGATATTTATNLVLLETGAGGTAAVGGLASVALPVAGVLAAAAGGYLIGDAIYDINPSILDGVLLPLFNFVTGNNLTPEDMYEYDNPTIPIIFDAEGKTYMDSRIIDAVGIYIESTKVGGESTYQNWAGYPQSPETLPLDVYPYQAIINNTVNSPQGIWLVASKTPFYYADTSSSYHRISSTIGFAYATIYNNAWNHYAPSAEYAVGPNVGFSFYNKNQPLSEGMLQINSTFYTSTALDGTKFDKNTLDPIAYPTGITKYTQGTPYAPLQFAGGLPAWNPIFLPESQPGILPAGVPLTDPLPEPERITPFINPIQVPIIDIPIPQPQTAPDAEIVPVIDPTPNTSNEPYPAPDPNRDPSQLPETSPATEPVQLPDPINSGATAPPLIPIIPLISSAATGLLHVYNPTNAQINEFGTWLWTTFSGSLIDTLSKLFNNPMDAVIGLHELYATPSTSGVTTIRAGYLDSGVASQLVSERYTEINCGALSVPEYWGNYLDYSPYTKAYCYLPFIGIVELNVDDIVGHGVEITYKVDAYNGSCIAIITTAKAGSPESITYQFPGNCSVEIPITSGMKSAMQGALIGAATLGIGAATGGAGGIAAAAMIGGVQGAARKNLVQHSGSFGSSFGAMGSKKPFLIIKRPKQKVVPGYNTNYGYPSHKMVLISSCSGYLKAIEVDVVSPTATEEEKHLIETELKSGVFVN